MIQVITSVNLECMLMQKCMLCFTPPEGHILIYCLAVASSEVEGGEEEEEVEEDEEEQEEEAWLDALEAGEVDERGYLPQKRESSTLTVRQVG